MYKFKPFQIAFLLFAVLIFNACVKNHATPEPQTEPQTPEKKLVLNDTIRFLENRIKNDPEDFIAHNKLAAQYLQRLRETGDQDFLELAERAARASLEILPAEQNKEGLALLARVEYSLHNFSTAREHALQLVNLEPNKSFPYQILGDALLELGEYEEAKIAFRQMEKIGGLQPLTKIAVEQRLARMALLYGDNPGAMRHFSNALKIASAMPETPSETVAWCRWQLGETVFAEGDYKTAEKYYLNALKSFPEHTPTIAALGKVRAAQGDLKGAIEQYEEAFRIMPDTAFAAALSDLFKLSGRDEDAKKQYEAVEKYSHLNDPNGKPFDRDLALFYANHDWKMEEAYNLAVKEYEQRRDIYGADAIAWTAFKAGKLNEAQKAIKEAMRLGTLDAQIFYHAGMIENAAGNKAVAKRWLEKALHLNPSFDLLQAKIAKDVLAKLESKNG